MSLILKPQKCSAESLEYCWSVLGPLDGQNPWVCGTVQQSAPPGVSYAWVWNPTFWWRSAEADLPGLKVFLWLEWSRLGLKAFSQERGKTAATNSPPTLFFFSTSHLEKPKALWMWQIHRFLLSDEDEERKLVPGPGRRSQNRNINATAGPGEIYSRSPGSISRQPH